MHKVVFCQNLFDNALTNSIHQARKDCLVQLSSDLLDYDTSISVTEIGKKLTTNTSVKHKIKMANYFVNNYKFEKCIPTIYQGLAQFFWGQAKELIVLVDWSGACSPGHYVLEASVVGHGRSIPLYHEIHCSTQQQTAEVHELFLMRLKQVIPKGISVTLITDAGFYSKWFKQVANFGWNFIGRVSSTYHYQFDGDSQWLAIDNILFSGYEKPMSLGKVKLGKINTVEGYLYTYKQKLSGKFRKKKHKCHHHDRGYSDGYKKGWILLSTLKYPALVLVRYYKKRMQIEQNFRDIKNEQLGIGLRRNASSGKTRINMLFFLATLLIIIFWWFGLMLEMAGKHRGYQANSIKNKRVRSFVHLARLGIRHEPELLTWESLQRTISRLLECYHQFIEVGVLC